MIHCHLHNYGGQSTPAVCRQQLQWASLFIKPIWKYSNSWVTTRWCYTFNAKWYLMKNKIFNHLKEEYYPSRLTRRLVTSCCVNLRMIRTPHDSFYISFPYSWKSDIQAQLRREILPVLWTVDGKSINCTMYIFLFIYLDK